MLIQKRSFLQFHTFLDQYAINQKKVMKRYPQNDVLKQSQGKCKRITLLNNSYVKNRKSQWIKKIQKVNDNE